MFQSAFKQKSPSYTTKLNLVALMDIFTILVFFLLLNSGEAERLESAKFVTLPNSSAGSPPHDDLVLLIGEDGVWLGDQQLMSMEDLQASDEPNIPALRDALLDFRERKGEVSSYEEEHGMALTIMGDQAVSYGLLKTVMATCREADFRDIALAVNQVAAPTPGGSPAEPDDAQPMSDDQLSMNERAASGTQGER